MAQIEQETLNEIVLSEDQVICALTNNPVKATEKELNLQSMILMMTEEYNFALEDMERDYRRLETLLQRYREEYQEALQFTWIHSAEEFLE